MRVYYLVVPTSNAPEAWPNFAPCESLNLPTADVRVVRTYRDMDAAAKASRELRHEIGPVFIRELLVDEESQDIAGWPRGAAWRYASLAHIHFCVDGTADVLEPHPLPDGGKAIEEAKRNPKPVEPAARRVRLRR